MILGSERTGPDLSYIGRKRSEAWEIGTGRTRSVAAFDHAQLRVPFGRRSECHGRLLVWIGDRVAAERMIFPPEAYAGNKDLFSTTTPNRFPISRKDGQPGLRLAGWQGNLRCQLPDLPWRCWKRFGKLWRHPDRYSGEL